MAVPAGAVGLMDFPGKIIGGQKYFTSPQDKCHLCLGGNGPMLCYAARRRRVVHDLLDSHRYSLKPVGDLYLMQRRCGLGRLPMMRVLFIGIRQLDHRRIAIRPAEKRDARGQVVRGES